jgi:hypothetical protein
MDLLKKLDNMITAEELLNKKFPEFEDLDNGNIWDNIEEVMIEFAKLHVKAALKEASENAEIDMIKYTDDYEINKKSILNAYPLEIIK